MTKIATAKEPYFGARPRSEGEFISSSDSRVLELFDLRKDASGVFVTEATAESVSAVWACVRLVAGSLSMLPVRIMRESNGVIQEEASRDSLWWMLNEEAAPNWTSTSMWEWVAKSMLLRGDGFVEIMRPVGQKNSPEIVGLRPLHPDVVQPLESDTFGVLYRVQRKGGDYRVVKPEDMLHFANFGFNGLRSPSAIYHYARRAIGSAIATEDYAAKFFASGAMQKHVIKSPAKMSDTATESLRTQWADRYSGIDNAYRPIVLTEGLDIKELSLSAEDSQLIASRQFGVIEIARAFGVPPILIQENEKTSSWGSGVEQLIIGYVRFTLAPHLKRFRDELNRKLIRRAGRTIQYDTEALTQPDSKAFGELLRQLVGGSQGPGIITINEARAALKRPPMPNGDDLYDPKSTAADAPSDPGSQPDPKQPDPDQPDPAEPDPAARPARRTV